VHPPGQAWEDYVHSTDELLMLMVGKLVFFLDTVADSVSGNDAELSSMWNVGGAPVSSPGIA